MAQNREWPQISIPEFKRLLGPLAERLTEQQIVELRDKEYRIADAIFEWWLRKRNFKPDIDSRKPTG